MIFHDVEQNSEPWDELRLGKVTGSKLGVIMANEGRAFGEPAKRYALQLALERVSGRKSEFSFTNDHMERGHEQEPVARMLYEAETFCEVTNGGFFDWGDYGDSPDGLVGTDGGVEVKSVIAPTHWDTIRRGSLDPAYRWQMVGHLDCTGRRWFDFVSFCADFPEGDQLVVYRVMRDDMADEIERLRARRAHFIANEVLPIYNQLMQRRAA